MHRPTRWLAALALLACALATPALATNITVPTNAATITAALATGADTIKVLPGIYPEDVTVSRGVVMLASGPAHVRRLTVSFPSGGGSGTTFTARGFRVDKQISYSSLFGDVTFDNCWADSTLTCRGWNVLVSECRVFGAASITGNRFATVQRSRFFGGGVRVGTNNADGSISDSYIEGPAAIGLAVDDGVAAIRNVVRGCSVGIQAACNLGTTVADNEVIDCSGNGIQVDIPQCGSAYYNLSFGNNLVLRCGGDGMVLSGTFLPVSSNRIQQVTGNGISFDGRGVICSDNEVRDAGGDGVRSTQSLSYGSSFTRNRATRCQNGFVVTGGGSFYFNVTGSDRADGFHVDSRGTNVSLSGNTSYLNSGDAYDVTSDNSTFGGTDSLDHNIGFASAYGVRWTLAGGSVPARTCNDWYGNTLGNATGVTIGATDLTLDPRFCNATHDDVALASSSPALNAPGCGRIGAVGQGCTTAVAVEEAPTQASSAYLRVAPLPTSGHLRFEWPRHAGRLTLEILDAAGARRWSATVDGEAGEATWNGVGDTGRAVAPGVYFARLSDGGHALTSRLVVVR